MAKMEIGAELAQPCPYRGLSPFGAEDARYFFGRGSDADLIAANVLSARVLVLHGPSGVGKSSVLQAALPCSLDRILPDPLVVAFRRWDCGFYGMLTQDARRQRRDAYKRYGAKHRWSADDEERELFIGCNEPEAPPLEPEKAPPLLLRGDSMASPFEPAPNDPQRSARRTPPLAPRTTRGDRKLAKRNSLERCAEAWAKGVGTPVVFVFDQFEQYFIGQDFGPNVEDHEFEADLARIVKRRDLSVHVLISIREDALHELNRLRARIPHILARSLKLDHLDQAAAKEAINGPLRVWLKEHGANAGPTTVSGEVVDALIQQVSRTGDSARIETPYLQLALKRLWEEEHRQGSSELRWETLKALGGASGIAKSHFQDTMKALPEDDQRLCATIFDWMVTPSGMKIALSAADLAKLANKDTESVRSVLEELTHGPSRIINCVRSPKDNQTFLFEIFHDVLARPILDWKRQIAVRRASRERRKKRLWMTGCALALAALALMIYREWELQRTLQLAEQANFATERGDGRLALLTALQANDSSWLHHLLRLTPDASTSALARAVYRPIGPVLAGHEKRLRDLAYSPDGKLIVTASRDRTARLWNAENGKALPDVVLKHRAEVSSVSFDSKGEHVITTSDDGWVRIWTLAGDELTRWRHNGESSARFAKFSPAGGIIATAPRKGHVRIWTWDGTAKQPAPAAVNLLDENNAEWQAAVTSLAFDPAGDRLVTTAREQPARIWDIHTGRLVHELPFCPDKHAATLDDAVLVAEFSPDGRRVLTGSREGKSCIWELATEPDGQLRSRRPLTLDGHDDRVTAVEFDGAGRRVVTASADGTLRLWDASSGEMLRLMQGPIGGSGSRGLVALHPDGEMVVASFSERVAHLWPLSARPEVRKLVKLQRKSTAIAASPDDYRLAIADDSTISVYDSASDKKIVPDFGTELPALSIAFDKGSDRLAVANGEAADIWDLNGESAYRRYSLGNHKSLVLSIAYDPPGRQLVTASQDRTARIWDAETGSPRAILAGHSAAVFAAVFSEDGRRVVTGSFDGTVRRWDAATGRQISEPIRIGRPVLALTRTQDDSEMVVTTLEEPTPARPFRTRTVVWDLDTGEQVWDDEGTVLSIASRRVRSSSEGDLIIMDAMGKTLALLPRHRDAITEMTSGGRGEFVYTASMDGTVRALQLVPWDPDLLVKYARENLVTLLPEDQRSLSAEEQRALGLSPAKTWLNLGGAVGTLMEAIRRAPRETELAGM
jgi:WD40 repeat protein